MRSIKIRRLRSARLFGLLLLVAAALPLSGYAQNTSQRQPAAQAQPEWLTMTIIRVKPEMVAAFRNFVRNRTNPALRRGGLMWQDVWQTAQFGDPFEYVIIAPMQNFAQFDAPGPLERGLGQVGLNAWRQEAGRLVTSVRTLAVRFRPDLSYQTEMTGPPRMGVVTFYHVVPGRNADFEEVLRNDFLPTIRRAQVRGFWVTQAQFGGNANEYITLALRENFAELDRGAPASQVLGPERAAELTRRLNRDNVSHVERMVIRLVPELSFRLTQGANR